MGRYIAKNLVAAGVADKVELQIAYAIGVAKPMSVHVDTHGTGKISETKIEEIINKVFDLRPGAIIKNLDLRRPIYRQTASYGHFGRGELNLPWERLDKVEEIKKLVVDFIEEEGVSIKNGLDYFRTDFEEYGEDTPVSAAQTTGELFSALLKNDEEHEVFDAVFNCLAGFASENPMWNAPNRNVRPAGFAANVLTAMLSDAVKDQISSKSDPYANLAHILDLQPIDIRAIMPDSPDSNKSLALLVQILKDKSLDPLFPPLCNSSIVIDPLSSAEMQPLTPEKLQSWVDGKKAEAEKGAATYFSLLVAEEVFNSLKTTSKNGDIQLAPWVPVMKTLKPLYSVHYQVGLLNAMCRCWSATGKKAGILMSMAKLVKDEGVIDAFAFNKWRVDNSDRNSTLKDEAFNNELATLF